MMNEVFEIKDTEINVEDIMSKIHENIERRKKEGLYTEEKLAEAERLKIGDTPKQADFIGHYIKTAEVLCNIDIEHYKFGIPPFLNHPGLGHMVLAGKEFIRRFLRFHTRGVFNQQIEFNRHMIQLVKGLHSRIEELEKEVSSLRKRESKR
jgi:hypothetical protein